MKTAATNSLTFHWTAERVSLLHLAGFVLVSLFFHALAFYLFQAPYPLSVSINPPPAQASLLTPSTPGYQTLIRWINAGDPSLITTPTGAAPKDSFQTAYKPFFASVHSLPSPAGDELETVRLPRVVDAMTGIAGTVSTKSSPVHPSLEFQGGLKFSGALAGRRIKSAPPIHLPAPAATTLIPASFLIGVSDRGEVRYLFLQNSSGDKSIDRMAAEYLSVVDFEQHAQPITWGIASFYWGNDSTRPPAQP